jgi:PTS system glucose-specific IIA component
VTRIFSTRHAYSVKHKSGLEIMVHIGLETVALGGEGFTAMVSEGDSVKVGDVIVQADLETVRSLAKDIVTPVVISEGYTYASLEKKHGQVSRGDILMELK